MRRFPAKHHRSHRRQDEYWHSLVANRRGNPTHFAGTLPPSHLSGWACDLLWPLVSVLMMQKNLIASPVSKSRSKSDFALFSFSWFNSSIEMKRKNHRCHTMI